ncbi:hypothetical protein M3Y94_00383900 [Aphelenchoides besseyi]|nr:hypothetical protein M3Y94_00383900 [Aphelenchoides besseyi]
MRWIFLNVPALLANETNIGTPGVRARISRKGINYVATILTQNLIPDVVNVQLNDGMVELQVSSEKVTLSEIKVNSLGKFGPVETDISAPNLVFVNIPNLNLSMSTLLTSENFASSPLSVLTSIKSENTIIRLSVEVKRTSVGAPNLHIHSCDVESADVQVQFANEINEQQLSSLEPTINDKALSSLKDLICNRIQFVVDDRVNERFGLLSTKISLSHINDEQLVKELAEKLRARRQRRAAVDQAETDDEYEAVDELTDMRRVQRAAPWDFGAGMQLPMGMNVGAGVGRRKRDTLIAGFNVVGYKLKDAYFLSLTDSLTLDYTILTDPKITEYGLEIESSGEISLHGRGGTPFGPVVVKLPERVDEQYMLQDLVSDYMVNSLMYHGHTLGLFNTRVDHTTPHLGAIMRTSCSLSSGVFFCLGDLFPTLRRLHPQRRLALNFNTVQAPVIRFRPQALGGISFSLLGRIAMLVIDPETRKEEQVAEMSIEVAALMKMRLTSSIVRPKITLERIKLTTLSPGILMQNELDDAVIIAREVLQRMVNDILREGLPTPLHPIFKMVRPKVEIKSMLFDDKIECFQVKVMDRALLLQTNFELNENLIRQLTASDLRQ